MCVFRLLIANNCIDIIYVNGNFLCQYYPSPPSIPEDIFPELYRMPPLTIHALCCWILISSCGFVSGNILVSYASFVKGGANATDTEQQCLRNVNMFANCGVAYSRRVSFVFSIIGESVLP